MAAAEQPTLIPRRDLPRPPVERRLTVELLGPVGAGSIPCPTLYAEYDGAKGNAARLLVMADQFELVRRICLVLQAGELDEGRIQFRFEDRSARIEVALPEHATTYDVDTAYALFVGLKRHLDRSVPVGGSAD